MSVRLVENVLIWLHVYSWFANNKLAVMVAEVEVEVVESGRGHEDGCKTVLNIYVCNVYFATLWMTLLEAEREGRKWKGTEL